MELDSQLLLKCNGFVCLGAWSSLEITNWRSILQTKTWIYCMTLLPVITTISNSTCTFLVSLSLYSLFLYRSFDLSQSNECFMLRYSSTMCRWCQIVFGRKNFLRPKITGIQIMTAVFTDANHLCCFAQIPIKYNLSWRRSGSVKCIHMATFSHPPLPESYINFALINIYSFS